MRSETEASISLLARRDILPFTKVYQSPEEMNKYKYLIDIDGNSSVRARSFLFSPPAFRFVLTDPSQRLSSLPATDGAVDFAGPLLLPPNAPSSCFALTNANPSGASSLSSLP